MGLFRLIFILSLVISHLSLAEVRYVSHSGSNTPPYLTWETAADSIMSAVNISSFGDTIYVANGVYEEQVVMIPGLSLIGAGMDSCVIDTHTLITSQNSVSVRMADSCLFIGFHIIVYNNWDKGIGISAMGSAVKSIVTLNTISNGFGGILFGDDPVIYKNIINNFSICIDLANSDALISNNIIRTDPNSQTAVVAGIRNQAFDFTYKPIIDSNLIYANRRSYGIREIYGADPVISNNTIVMNHAEAIFLGDADTVRIYNNLMYGLGSGIDNEAVQHLFITNNYIGGDTLTAILASPNDIIENNIIANATRGIEKWSGYAPPSVKYNSFWNNGYNFYGFINMDTTNIYQLPMIVNEDSTEGDLDFHLQMFSPLIDKGDPDILDKDGTRSDIGLYGGPFGEIYTYQDLPPSVPVNLSAIFTVDSTRLLLKWNSNKEADISHYNLYRDTTENFTADSTTFAASIPDTFYINIIPEGIDNLYFKLTAVDNQGNESEPSEELHVFLTGIINNEKFIINNCRLYQNYPNPFNPSTKIGYRLKESGYVKLYVYDIKGELVETLVNQWGEKGYHEVKFDGEVRSQELEASSQLASGIYVYQIMVKNENGIPVFSDIKKMVLVK